MNSKSRAYLKSLAMNITPSFLIGKDNLTPEVTEAIREAFNTKELIKIGILKNSSEDVREVAGIIAERTHSEVVQTIGKKIVLYKQAEKPEDRKIVLPKA